MSHNIFKVCTDSLILKDFCNVSQKDTLVELCCGEGYILKELHNNIKLGIGIDINPNFLPLWKNIKESVPNIEFILSNIKLAHNIIRKKVDKVICNPPYYKKSSFRISPNFYRAISRTEILMNLEDVFKISSEILKSNGKLFLIHLSQRLTEIFIYSQKYNFAVKRLKPVIFSSKQHDEVKLVLIELSFNDEKSYLKFEIPIYI